MTFASARYCFFLISIFLLLLNCDARDKICPFEYLFQFGDSLSDTGNLIHSSPAGAAQPAARLPYGETFPRRPTGRFSDGLLIVDFIAASLQLPLLNPYLQRNVSFDHGANFAVAGSTAIDASALAAKGVQAPVYDVPLNVQLNWFRNFLDSTCPSPQECMRRLSRSLVVIGPFGGNEFSYASAQGKSISEIQSYIPDIINSTANAVREVIRRGVSRVVVPGTFPLGCFPFILTLLADGDTGAYDNLGCLRNLNDLATFQNNYLQGSLASLRQEFPEAVILYADYYSAFLSVLRRAPFDGFDRQVLLKACCGTGGSYNYDPNRGCGTQGVPVCPNPNRYMNWDGVHLTQEAYRQISEIIIRDLLLRIQCVW